MSRPTKPKSEQKTVRLQVLVEPALAKELADEAAIAERDMSAYLRWLVLTHPGRKSKRKG